MSKTEKRIGCTSASDLPAPGYHFAGMASFLFVCFACAWLLQTLQGGHGLSAGQVALINLAAPVQALSISTGVACLVLPLFIVGAVAGRLTRHFINLRQP